jgi:hypothetical protein
MATCGARFTRAGLDFAVGAAVGVESRSVRPGGSGRPPERTTRQRLGDRPDPPARGSAGARPPMMRGGTNGTGTADLPVSTPMDMGGEVPSTPEATGHFGTQVTVLEEGKTHGGCFEQRPSQ